MAEVKIIKIADNGFDTEHDSSTDQLTMSGFTADSTNGYAVTDGVNITDNIIFDDVADTIAGIQNQNLVDKSAAEFITGEWDFTDGEFTFPNTASSSPTKGDSYWDETTNKLYVYDGATWIDVGATYWDRTGTVLSPKTAGDDIETTGSGTFGKGIFDVTDTEALLVRKDGDGGDILVVDTTNTRFGFNAVTSHLYSVAVFSPQSTNPFDKTGGGFLMRAGKGYSTSTSIGGTGGKFELEGGAGGTANWGLMIKTGGDGGILKLRGGVGGNAEGTGTLRGGNGGKLQLVGGNKGYGATSDGDGGDVEIVSGLGVTHGEINLIIGDFAGTTILTGLSDGSGIQQNDNIKHYWGTGKDASAYYDGTDFILNAQEVGSGHIILNTPKTTTGDPTGVEGKIYWNTVDNVIKMYADGAWRTLASW